MKVYELLDKPEKWIQGHLAVDANKKLVEPKSEQAVRWCVMGAMAACYDEEDACDFQEAWNKLFYNVERNISTWNDAPERTYEEVIALCKELDI